MNIADILLHTLERNSEIYSVYSENDKTLEFGYKGESYKLTIEKIE